MEEAGGMECVLILTVNTIHSAAYNCLRESDQSWVKKTIRDSNILPLFLFGFTQLVINGSWEPSLFVSVPRSYAIIEFDSFTFAARRRHAANDSRRLDLSTRQSKHSLSKYMQARASVLISILARTQAASACCFRLCEF